MAKDCVKMTETRRPAVRKNSLRAGFFHLPGPGTAIVERTETASSRHWPLLILLALLAAASVSWAALTQVHEVATAPGQILTTAPLVTIQHLDGGRISEVPVREGEHVTQGQVLLRLEASDVMNAYAALESELNGKIAEEKRWEAVRAALLKKPLADEPKSLLPSAADLAALPPAERDNVTAILASYQTNLALAKDDAAAARAKAQSLASQEQELRAAKEIADQKTKMREQLYEEGVGAKLSVLESRRDASVLAQQLASLEGERQVAMLDADRLTMQGQEAHDRLLEQAYGRISDLATETDAGKERLAELAARRDRLVVTSPIAGLLQRLGAVSPGSVIGAGGLVAEIVPDDSDLIAVVRLQPRDRGFIKVGQPAKVKIHSFDFARYGTLPATVDVISPTTLFDEHQQPYYEVRLKLDGRHTKTFADGLPLVPGMTVQADINTGEKTVLQYLLKPVYTMSSGALHER